MQARSCHQMRVRAVKMLSINSRVCCSRSGVVGEAEAIPVAASPLIQETLVSSVPGTVLLQEVRELLEFVFSRSEDHHSRVEYVWPSYVGNSGKLVLKREKVGHWSDRKNIRVDEDDFRELGEPESVQFCEDGVKIRPACYRMKNISMKAS